MSRSPEFSPARDRRLKGPFLRMKGEQCRNTNPETGEACETYIFPPRDICPECGREVEIDSSEGEIYSSDSIREALRETVSQEKGG